MKNSIKKLAPGVFGALKAVKAKVKLYRQSFALVHDLARLLKYMRWDRAAADYWRLSAELIFQYHKIEKGLCIGGPQRFFGKEAAERTLDLMEQWKAAGHSLQDPVYVGCHHAMLAYRRRFAVTPPPEVVGRALERRLEQLPAIDLDYDRFDTPMAAVARPDIDAKQFFQLAASRRSVRWFAQIPVPRENILQAVRAAQLAPSACNRQPWRLHVYDDRAVMDSLLALQNGNSGFGQQIPVLMAVCVDTRCFFDATERHEPYLDAGLFLMSLIHALQADGIASCCLNWCVDTSKDLEIRRRGSIPDYEVVATLLAVGYPAPDALVPRSARRDVHSVAVFH